MGGPYFIDHVTVADKVSIHVKVGVLTPVIETQLVRQGGLGFSV